MNALTQEVTVIVAGSFGQENLPFIQQEVADAEQWGIRVVAPRFNTVRNPGDSFVVLDTDAADASPRQLEQSYMDKIAGADALVVVNHRRVGRVGMSAAAEMAHAALTGVPLVTTHSTRITERDYPDTYFSDEVTPAEQDALYRVGSMVVNLAWPAPNLGYWLKLKERTSPMPTDHPDYAILLGLRDRLLASLPAEASAH